MMSTPKPVHVGVFFLIRDYEIQCLTVLYRKTTAPNAGEYSIRLSLRLSPLSKSIRPLVAADLSMSLRRRLR